MGWGTRPEDVRPCLPRRRPVRDARRRRALRPHRTPGRGGRPDPRLPGDDRTPSRSSTTTRSPWPCTTSRGGTGSGRPLLLLHGLGERSPEAVPDWAAVVARSGVRASTSPATALSTVPHGRWLHGRGADGRRRRGAGRARTRRPCVGRGLGAYVALLIAGARPQLVQGRGAVRRAGTVGGGVGPTSATVLTVGRGWPARPIRGPSSSSPATSGRPTTPPPSPGPALQLSGVAWPFAVLRSLAPSVAGGRRRRAGRARPQPRRGDRLLPRPAVTPDDGYFSRQPTA